MATKRMFHQDVIETDDFFEMEALSQVLYVHLSMRADDEGFIKSVQLAMRVTKSNEKNLEELIKYGYLIAFESGVVAIRHWYVNNTLKNIKPTTNINERLHLKIINNIYEYCEEARRFEEVYEEVELTNGTKKTKIKPKKEKVSGFVRGELKADYGDIDKLEKVLASN